MILAVDLKDYNTCKLTQVYKPVVNEAERVKLGQLS